MQFSKPVGLIDFHEWTDASYDDEGNIALPAGTVEWFVCDCRWEEWGDWAEGGGSWVSVLPDVLDGPFETETQAVEALAIRKAEAEKEKKKVT